MATVGEVRELSGEFVYEWTINDFLSLSCKVDEFYESPLFQFGGESWSLKIYPCGETGATGYVELYLRKISSRSPINIDFTLGLKTVEEKMDPELKFTYDFTEFEGYGSCMLLQRSKLKARKSMLMPSGDLTVLCKIKYHKPVEVKKVNGTCASGSSTSSEDNKILGDLKQMFLKQEYCDVVIRVKGQEFPAHKVILAARSPVLASAFLNDMKEKKTNSLDIEDGDPSTFPDFLGFLYYGDGGIISAENVFSLFRAADKYIVQDLREKCVAFMKENLSLDNFCESITIALLHKETELVDLATNFFVANAENIVKSVKWQSFNAENPTEGNELFIKFLASSRCVKP